jgi:hypothetical protein
MFQRAAPAPAPRHAFSAPALTSVRRRRYRDASAAIQNQNNMLRPAMPPFPQMFNAGAAMQPSMLPPGFQGGLQPFMGNMNMSASRCSFPAHFRAVCGGVLTFPPQDQPYVVCAAGDTGNGRYTGSQPPSRVFFAVIALPPPHVKQGGCQAPRHSQTLHLSA